MKRFVCHIIMLFGVIMNVKAQTVMAVVNDQKTQVVINSESDYTATFHKELVIKEPKAERLADFVMSMYKGVDINSFSCTVVGASGKTVRKYKGSDLKRTEYSSSSLAIDYYTLYLDVDILDLPATVTYDYKVHYKGNVVSYPMFMPQNNYDEEVKRASYEITVPPLVNCRYEQLNVNLIPKETKDNVGNRVLTFELSDLKAIKQEKNAKPLEQLVPIIYFAPETFSYYKTSGSLASWKEMGTWAWSLMQGTDILPDELKRKVHELTDACKTDKERIEKLYNFLRTTTRYVSIQLGIGGYKPMTAEYVYKNGFGDCKALSNYMRALLAEVGIKSVYTMISMGKERLLTSMANFQQLDHVILKVQLEDGENLWLECTNPKLPLGYIHDNISGHDAIEVTEQGGRLVVLPEYADSLNLNVSTVDIALDAAGIADISIDDDYFNHRYGLMYALALEDKKKQAEIMKTFYMLPQTEEIEVSVEDKSEPYKTPCVTTHVRAKGVKYANTTGMRLFVPLNPTIRKNQYERLADDRKNDVNVAHGYKNVETIVLNLPQGYAVESLPADFNLSNKYGNFSFTIQQDANRIIVNNVLQINSGTYPATSAADFDALVLKMRELNASKLVLKKQ